MAAAAAGKHGRLANRTAAGLAWLCLLCQLLLEVSSVHQAHRHHLAGWSGSESGSIVQRQGVIGHRERRNCLDTEVTSEDPNSG